MFSEFVKRMIFARMIEFGDGTFKLFGVPGTVTPVFLTSDILMKMYKKYGDKVFDIAYEAGLAEGQFFGRSMVEHFDGMRPSELVTKMKGTGEIMGFGSINTIDIDLKKPMIRFRLENSSLAADVLKRYGRTKLPVDQIMAGACAGIFSVLLKKKLVCKEISCIAMGSQFCEFVVKEAGK